MNKEFVDWYNQYIMRLPPNKQFTVDYMYQAYLAGKYHSYPKICKTSGCPNTVKDRNAKEDNIAYNFCEICIRYRDKNQLAADYGQ